jgi:hypothetical protein
VEEVVAPVEEVVAPVEEVVAPVEEVVAPVEEVVARVNPPYIPQPSLLWYFVSPPPPPLMPDSLYPYTPKSTVVYEKITPPLRSFSASQPPPSHLPPKFIVLPHKESQPPAQQQTPIIRSVAKAIAYRRTKRQRRHHNTRGKTRRSQPAA